MNCVLSNPFYRTKVIKSQLIKTRIAAITDRQILMDQFVGVFQKSFRHSSITIMYDKPITTCSILISADFELKLQFKTSLPKINTQRECFKTMISGECQNTDVFIRSNERNECILVSTKSGIVQCDDGDIYVITTGHYMGKACSPKNLNYTLIDIMWPNVLNVSDAEDIVKSKSYDSTNDGASKESFVSDIAILKPNIDIRTVTKCPRSDIIEYYTDIRGSEIPILPGSGTTIPIQELKAKLVYTGCRTKGEMEVIGSGYFCQVLNKMYIHERFYVANHISSHLNKDFLDGDTIR